MRQARSTFRPLLLYWGRRGLSRFAMEVALGARRDLGCPALISVSRDNEMFTQFDRCFARDLITVNTFASHAGAAIQAWRIPGLRRRMVHACANNGITHVIDLMPHLWMPFVEPAIRANGVRYIPLVHDAQIHPGDLRTRLASVLTDRLIARSDHLVTLSQSVTDGLCARLGADAALRTSTLFHPDLVFSNHTETPQRRPHAPPRALFLGRIMAYKGLPLFVETIEGLKAAGFDIEVGVFGEGPLHGERPRLESIGAEIANRWLTDDEIATVLGRYDVVIASHLEASQSGIVAAAHGAGLPVVTTPVGGLVEQVRDGETGLVASAVTAQALGVAIRRLFETPGLYAQMQSRIQASRDLRSTATFTRSLLEIARAVR